MRWAMELPKLVNAGVGFSCSLVFSLEDHLCADGFEH